jgi:hypothetical protein
MELHTGFHCGSSGVVLGSRWVARANENEGEGLAEGKEVKDKKLDYSNHSNRSNHSGLLLLERRKEGDHE